MTNIAVVSNRLAHIYKSSRQLTLVHVAETELFALTLGKAGLITLTLGPVQATLSVSNLLHWSVDIRFRLCARDRAPKEQHQPPPVDLAARKSPALFTLYPSFR